MFTTNRHRINSDFIGYGGLALEPKWLQACSLSNSQDMYYQPTLTFIDSRFISNYKANFVQS